MRNKLSDATRELRKERDELEAAWETTENELAAIQNQMSDTETYEDSEHIGFLTKRHHELKDQAAGLMDKYDAVVRRIARKEAELD